MKKFKYAKFNDIDKIRFYLESHPEVFTDELMAYLAETYLNYHTVRTAIKEQYPYIVKELLDNNRIDIIPYYNEKEYEKTKK